MPTTQQPALCGKVSPEVRAVQECSVRYADAAAGALDVFCVAEEPVFEAGAVFPSDEELEDDESEEPGLAAVLLPASTDEDAERESVR